MSMHAVQGPQKEERKFIIDDTIQVKSSWGSRSVKIVDLNTNKPHTIKLKELVNVLEEKIKSANTPQEIKRAREMFHTIKTKEDSSRSRWTQLLDLIGFKNTYDTKFEELGKKIQAPLLREEHLAELANLKLSLESKESELPEALRLVDDENSYNKLLSKDNQLTKSNNELNVLNHSIQDIKAKINVLQKEVLDKRFPEIKVVEKEVKRYLLSPEEEDNAKLAAYSRFDQLINVDDDDLRLFAAKMDVKMAAGYEVTPKEEAKLDFIQSLNKIPKDFPLKKEKDKSLIEKKNIFIENLKSDSPIRALLANEELQKLAKEMDKVMDVNVSMQDFATVVGVTYPERIRVALGREDIDDASVALVLLQENISFPNALKNLYAYRDDHHRDFSLEPVHVDLAPNLLAMELLNDVSNIKAQIDKINEQLDQISTQLFEMKDEDVLVKLNETYESLLKKHVELHQELKLFS